MMTTGKAILAALRPQLNLSDYRKKHWEGSSKSTIARLLKKGLEQYSKIDEGMLFTFSWRGEGPTWHKCPMHEEPLHLVPQELRSMMLARLNENRRPDEYHVTIQGELCP